MSERIELPHLVWVRMKMVSERTQGKSARIAAIRAELDELQKLRAVVLTLEAGESVEGLVESIYEEIWETQ